MIMESTKRTQEELEEAYLRQLTPKEKKSYDIAKCHLTMSFDLSKSNGFLRWRAAQK
jgi:hypothetical protein